MNYHELSIYGWFSYSSIRSSQLASFDCRLRHHQWVDGDKGPIPEKGDHAKFVVMGLYPDVFTCP